LSVLPISAEVEPRLEAAPCPACDSTEFRVLFEATDRLYRTASGVFRIVECGRCRLIRLDPRPCCAPALEHRTRWPAGNALADRMERAYRRFLLSDHAGFVLRAIEEAGEPGTVLDLSPDGGLFRETLTQRGVPVVGMDCSPRAAAANWRIHGTPCFCASLPSAPLAPGSCRAVLMIHVLEHTADPAAWVEAAHSLLRDGGRLVVQVPNASCWEFLLLGENWSGLDVPRHLIDFRAHDLEALLELCGFEILRRKNFSLRDNPGTLAKSLAPGLDPVVRRARGVPETPAGKLARHLLWLALMTAVVPATVIEAACRAGSTILIEARKKA
jgi:SAM-dependent methyltransferase